MRNDLLRRLLIGLDEHHAESAAEGKKPEPLKIYADNKESYFQVKYLPDWLLEQFLLQKLHL